MIRRLVSGRVDRLLSIGAWIVVPLLFLALTSTIWMELS